MCDSFCTTAEMYVVLLTAITYRMFEFVNDINCLHQLFFLYSNYAKKKTGKLFSDLYYVLLQNVMTANRFA